MSIFDERTLNENDKNNLKIIIDDTVEALLNIDGLQNHIKDNIKGVCEKINEGFDKSQHIKPALVMKVAKAKVKENLAEQKDQISEVEEALEILYK